MPDIHDRYLTIGKMANISGVTKHTLFHYDEIGLLKPEFTHDNGYRYYSYRQTYILDIIHVLKKAGSSLQEIKGFLQNRNTLTLVELFKQKQQDLEAELLRIKRMQDILQNAIQMTETSPEFLRDTPSIEECGVEYLIATPLERGDDEEFYIKLSEHRNYCEIRNINHEFPIWALISNETFESDNFAWSYVANRIQAPIPGDRLITKPEGLYVVMDHRGSYESISEACIIIKDYIARNGMKASGNVYIMDLLNYFSEMEPDSYVVRLSVAVSV